MSDLAKSCQIPVRLQELIAEAPNWMRSWGNLWEEGPKSTVQKRNQWKSSWAFHNQHCRESFLSGSLAACCNNKPHGHILPQFCVLTKVLRGYPRTEAPTPEHHSRSSGLRVVSPWGILISSDIHRLWTHRKPKGRAYSGPTLESDISMFTSAVTHLTSRSLPQVGNIPFRFFLLLCLFDLVWRFANAKPEVKPCLFIRYHLENLHGQFRSCGYSFHLCMARLLLFQECLIYDAHGKHGLSFFGASAQLRADHCGTRIFFWNCCGETDGEISTNSESHLTFFFGHAEVAVTFVSAWKSPFGATTVKHCGGPAKMLESWRLQNVATETSKMVANQLC